MLDVSAQQLRKGLALAVMANIIWGVSALYWIETDPVSPADVVAHRAIWSLPVAAMVLILASRLSATWALLKQLKTLLWSLLGTVLLSLNWGVFVYAVSTGRATEASLGYFMLPLLTIIVGKVVFQEVLGLAQRIAVALALCAVLIQIVSFGSLPWVSLVVSSSFALYGAMRKKIEADTMQGLFIETLCMAPFALAWLWATGGAGMGQHGMKVDVFLLMAGMFTTAPLLTYVAASRLLPLNIVGLTSYLGPSLQLLVAQTLLGESIDLVTALSFALVWLGVLLVSGQGVIKRKRLHS
ncbi:EamA family transporter RarD [Luminiphilus sp.]|nr:EamA family transporter RarD [Luminiphilus sp.]